MAPHQLTIYCMALVLSASLSVAYAYWLDHISDHYMPDLLVVVVAIGVGAIFDTLSILDRQFDIHLTAWRILYVFLAWGIPIVVWQIGQLSHLHKIRNELRHALER